MITPVDMTEQKKEISEGLVSRGELHNSQCLKERNNPSFSPRDVASDKLSNPEKGG